MTRSNTDTWRAAARPGTAGLGPGARAGALVAAALVLASGPLSAEGIAPPQDMPQLLIPEPPTGPDGAPGAVPRAAPSPDAADVGDAARVVRLLAPESVPAVGAFDVDWRGETRPGDRLVILDGDGLVLIERPADRPPVTLSAPAVVGAFLVRYVRGGGAGTGEGEVLDEVRIQVTPAPVVRAPALGPAHPVPARPVLALAVGARPVLARPVLACQVGTGQVLARPVVAGR